MKITPSTEQKKLTYPVLLTAAAVAATTLASCQQHMQQGTPMPEQPPFALGGIK